MAINIDDATIKANIRSLRVGFLIFTNGGGITSIPIMTPKQWRQHIIQDANTSYQDLALLW